MLHRMRVGHLNQPVGIQMLLEMLIEAQEDGVLLGVSNVMCATTIVRMALFYPFTTCTQRS